MRGSGVVCDVPPERLADFKEMGVTSTYKPRQVIFSAGNRSDGLYLVCHGAVKLYHSDRFGRDHILEVAAPGAVLGEIFSDPEETLSVSAESVTEAQLCHLERNRLLRFLKSDPLMGARLIEALSSELALARRKAGDLALKRADSRLASLILQLVGVDADSSIRLDYTRRELAEMVGVSTETAIRLLAKFKRDGVISLAGRRLVVTDQDKLARIARYSDIEASR
jgi:CRP-like cAMP-binding protein